MKDKKDNPKKSKLGAEELPIEEVENVNTGDFTHLFPELQERIRKAKADKKK